MSQTHEADGRASRRRAAQHLLHPRQLKESLLLVPQPSLRNSLLAGLQTALTAVVAIVAVYLSPWPELIGFAGLGALIALFGRFESHSRRAWLWSIRIP